VELYDKFFATAFPKTVAKLGIVYTPVEIVDFILRSADVVLRQEFGQGLTDEGVHILDPFTGTGTFMVRLLQLGLIEPHDLARKYAEELHANEILLLAYYIAAVNIETTYYDVMTSAAAPGGGKRAAQPGHEYVEFPGLVLTDTFQSWEDDDVPDLDVFPENNERLERLKKLPITVIVGNPPYSAGQDSNNEDNANEVYPSLDRHIRDSYAERSEAKNLNKLYDSYIRAIKWATLRIQDRGVIAYVTNGGWIDSTTADGMRKSLAEEFTSIHVLNLRGNQRTAGEQSRREGGKVFGGGSRATVAVTILVRNPAESGPAIIHYTDIGDYLTREQKLAKIAAGVDVTRLEPVNAITPNEFGDWLNQRAADFGHFVGIESVFGEPSAGLKTARDYWAYSFSRGAVTEHMKSLIEVYETERRNRRTSSTATKDPSLISWTRGLLKDLDRGRERSFSPESLAIASYRPFTRQHLYFSRPLNDMVYRIPRLYPTADAPNLGFYAIGVGATADFSCLMSSAIPDVQMLGAGQNGRYFTRWRYEPTNDDGALDLGSEGEVIDGYRQIDNITDGALKRFATAYGEITKDDVFFYVYGLLHSPEYRETYAADLKKMLPRIPLVEDPWPFVDAGRKLSELHLGYETVTPYPLDGLDTQPPAGEDPYDFHRVQKMAFAKVRDPETKKLVADRTEVIYNSRITLSGIPEAAYRYQLGSRSAVEWILDRYQVKTDKASGIVNDPNDWSKEVSDPRYIIDLLARIVTVSLETMAIVDALPALAIRKDQGNGS
jgi:predicted helicase